MDREYYAASGNNSKLEQNPVPVTGGRVPNSPFFINTFLLAANLKIRNENIDETQKL